MPEHSRIQDNKGSNMGVVFLQYLSQNADATLQISRLSETVVENLAGNKPTLNDAFLFNVSWI